MGCVVGRPALYDGVYGKRIRTGAGGFAAFQRIPEGTDYGPDEEHSGINNEIDPRADQKPCGFFMSRI